MRRFLGAIADEADVDLERANDGAHLLVFRFTHRNGDNYASTSVNSVRLSQLPDLMHKLEIIEAGI